MIGAKTANLVLCDTSSKPRGRYGYEAFLFSRIK